MSKIYILTSFADDYHGAFQIHAWTDDLEAMKLEVARRKKTEQPCPECGERRTWRWMSLERLPKLNDKAKAVERRLVHQKQNLVQACARCGRPLGQCDGRIWRVNDGKELFEVCTSETEIQDGERVYHYVRGHGEEWDLPVEPAMGGRRGPEDGG